jgi:hypothetical protein
MQLFPTSNIVNNMLKGLANDLYAVPYRQQWDPEG